MYRLCHTAQYRGEAESKPVKSLIVIEKYAEEQFLLGLNVGASQRFLGLEGLESG